MKTMKARARRSVPAGRIAATIWLLGLSVPVASGAPAEPLLVPVPGDVQGASSGNREVAVVAVPEALVGSEAVTIPLPSGLEITAVRDRVTLRSPGNLSWSGHVAAPYSGAVLLVARDDLLVGRVVFESKDSPPQTFRIRPTGDGLHAISGPHVGSFECDVEHVPAVGRTAESSAVSGTESAPGCPTRIDVLVAYTAAAAAALPGIEAEVQLMEDSANTTYLNSQINQEIRVVHIHSVTYSEADLQTDLNRITEPADSYMDEVHALRDNYGADLVCLLVGDTGGGCGRGWLLEEPFYGNNSFAPYGFSVVDVVDCTGAFGLLVGDAFTHELGHNMGACHEPGTGCDGLFPDSHGLANYHPTIPGVRTIMAASGGTIMHFTNPSVMWEGEVTGIPGLADNARTLNITASHVAGFRPTVGPKVLYVPCQLPTIQAAIDSAASGDTVLVADGTYTGTGNKDLDFGGKNLVLVSQNGPATTVIDCEGSGQAVIFDSGEDLTAVLSGFTLTGAGPSPNGTILVNGASPRIEDCVVSGNVVDQGGGLSAKGNSDPRLVDCVITGNTAVEGGAVHLETGATATLIGCTISGNVASNRGGGVKVKSATSSVSLTRSVVWGNCAGEGEDLYLANNAAANLTCSLFDTTGVWGPGDVIHDSGTVSMDPRFCASDSCQGAPSDMGDYRVNFDSPCLPENNSCGQLIGARGACNTNPVGVGPGPEDLLGRHVLYSAYPNPVLAGVHIQYRLAETGSVGLVVFDLQGRRVRVLEEEVQEAGLHRVHWDGRDDRGLRVSPGIYFYHLRSGSFAASRKLVIVR